MERTTVDDDALKRRLDHELRMVREAILVVASQRARSVTVAGLLLGDAILEQARHLALDAGVRLVPLWSTDDAQLAIRIEAPEA
jgi:hypothetical protein